MNLLLETNVMPYSLLAFILIILSICFIIAIIIVGLVKKDTKRLKKSLVGLVFIVVEILLFVTTNKYQQSLSVASTVSDLPNWFAFLVIIINFILVTLFLIILKLKNNYDKNIEKSTSWIKVCFFV